MLTCQHQSFSFCNLNVSVNGSIMTKITSYKIYNEEAKKRKKINPLDEIYPKLPEDKFDVIYADPPWDYGGKMQFDKTSMNEKFDPDKKVFISSASFKYPTVTTEQLKELNVHDISTDNSLLFMWTTGPFLDQSIELGRHWGFEFRTVAFVWNKMVHNPGKYTMSFCEFVLLFKRGKIPEPRGARNIKQLVNIPRGEHSEKPLEVLRNIHEMFPTQKKIELFARSREVGWNSWGLEAILDNGTRFITPLDNIESANKKLQKELF